MSMTGKLIAALLAALTLAGCGSMGCAGGANTRGEGGGCTTHVTFLR
jgi:hypothetical protein